MIEMKLGQIVAATEAIKNVLAAKLPIKTAYQLSKIGRALGKELEVHDEQKNRLITELGTEIDGQIRILPTDPNFKVFMEQYSELLGSDIKIDLEPMKLADFGDKAEVTASDLMLCERLILE